MESEASSTTPCGCPIDDRRQFVRIGALSSISTIVDDIMELVDVVDAPKTIVRLVCAKSNTQVLPPGKEVLKLPSPSSLGAIVDDNGIVWGFRAICGSRFVGMVAKDGSGVISVVSRIIGAGGLCFPTDGPTTLMTYDHFI